MTPPDSWPASWQYEEAIQNPHYFFTDAVADLRAAEIAKDAKEVPAISSGGSAVVFKATVGSDDLAIRCFTRSARTVQERYTTFCEYLKSDGRTPPEYLVDFEYRDKGVMVEGVCYPLLRMKWSPGKPLRSWVAANRAHGRPPASPGQ